MKQPFKEALPVFRKSNLTWKLLDYFYTPRVKIASGLAKILPRVR